MRLALRRLVTTAAALLVAASAFAQGHVVGTIRNQDRQPVRGATVTATSPTATPATATTTSDAKGRFSFLGLRGGQYAFTIEAPGYVTARTTASVRYLGNNPAVDVVLRAVQDLPPSGALAGLDVDALQHRLDAAAEGEKAGRFDEAIAIYRDIITRHPALTMVHLALGGLLERRQDAAGAAAEYRAVLAGDPANAKARAGVDRLSRQ